MDTKESEIATASSTDEKKKKKKKSNVSRLRLHPRIIQNFVLVWLDPNMNDELDEEHRDILKQVQSIVNKTQIFSNVDQCLTFLEGMRNEKALMIVSGIFGRETVPHIHHMTQIDSMYVFCGVKSQHEKWAKTWPKVKGVFNQIAPICDLLQKVIQKSEQISVSLSFVTPTKVSDQTFDQLDQSFMYTQILKEILLEIKYNKQSPIDFVSYCREQYHSVSGDVDVLKEFQDDYDKYSPIYWYTHPGFIHAILNRALRTHEVETIIKMGFFIQDLYNEIDKLHLKQTDNQPKQSFVVYRGQGLSQKDFESLVQAKGGLMSFNSFLSTSKKRAVSLEFSRDALNNMDLIGVLFKMVIDPSELATPYAFIDDDSYFQNEEEVLFSMHTVFRIGEVKQMQKNDRLYQVILTLTNNRNKQLNSLTELLREETQGSTGWHRLGMLLVKLGKFKKAEQVYETLFNLATDESEKAMLHHQLGLTRRNQGAFENALMSYKQALDIYEQTYPSDGLKMATTLNNIGHVYLNMGDYSEALSYYKKSLHIYEENLSENHLSRAILYNNLGLVYRNMGDFNQALGLHEKALALEQEYLPSNHPSLATSYKNIGLVYKDMGEYIRALSSEEKALELEQNTLPPRHPCLAISYSNIGLLYNTMGEYPKALSFYEKTLEIYQEILPPNHPDLSVSLNNIGSVYKNMSEYSKALSFYKKTLEIENNSFPSNHPTLAVSYSNIGTVYDNLGEYSQALSSYEKALEIYRTSLTSEHPLLAIAYNNIGSVHDNMGDYETALRYYKRSLEIEQKSLPPDHSDLATSYNNIGLIYDKLSDYQQAITCHEKALEIYQKTLPVNHPDLANSYNNLGLAYEKIHEYSKACLLYEKALDIRRNTLPPNNPDLIACYGNLSQVHIIMGDHSKALAFYDELVQARTTLMKDEPHVSTTYPLINQIYNEKENSSKTLSLPKPIIIIDQESPEDKLHRLKNFRKKLERLNKKIEASTKNGATTQA